MAQLPPGFVLDQPDTNSAPAVPQVPGVIQGKPKSPPPRTADQVLGDQLSNIKTQQEIEAKSQELAQGDQAKAIEAERKAAAFLIRALGANKAYEDTGVGPRGYIGQAIHSVAPDALNQLWPDIGNSPQRQVADSAQDEFIAASLRQDSGAAIPPEELDRQRRIYFPIAGDSQEAIEQKRQARRRALEGLRQSAGRLEDETQKRYEQLLSDETAAAPPPPVFSPADPQMEGNKSGFRNEDDPALAGVLDGYRQLLSQNTPPGKVVQWLRERGVSDPEVLRTSAQQASFRLKYPNVPIENYDLEKVDDRVVPLSGLERAITELGDNPVGSYLVNAGQFLAGNTLDNLAGNPDRARAAIDVISMQNPNAAAIGQVSGGILGSLGGEAALARMGMAGGFGRGLAADVVTGAANGAGAADSGNRGLNALMGGLASGGGNIAGNALIRGGARLIGPTGGTQAPLYASGVRPTLGQRVADKGLVGGAINRIEQGLQAVPLVGSAIRGAREEARDQFQIGAFNEALGEVGERLPKGMRPGTAPHAYAQKTFNRVYSEARKGMRMVGDEQLSNEMAGLSEQVGQLSEPSIKRFNTIFRDVVSRRVKDGELSGDSYKDAISGLGKVVRSIRNSQSGDGELADALEGLQGVLENAARRHSDPDAVALLDAADAGYAKFVRIEEAAKSRGGDAGTFTPTQFDSAVQRASGSTRSKAYLRGDALMQDYAAAGKSLADTVPDSGTAERIAAGGAAGFAGFYNPQIAAFLGLVGAGYAPGIRKIQQELMAPAGPQRRAIAEQLKKRAALVSKATAAGAVASRDGDR